MSDTEKNILEENAQTNGQTIIEGENTLPKISGVEHVNDSPSVQPPEETRCPNCHKVVGPNEAFCSKCGYKVGLTEQEKIFQEELDRKKEKSKKLRKRLLTILLPVAVVVIVSTICFKYRYPILYSLGSSAFENEHYSIAETLYTWAGDYKNSEKNAKLSSDGVHYKNGLKQLAKNNFVLAYDEFTKANGFEDSQNKEIEAAYLAANEFFDQKAYDEATEYYHLCVNYEDTWEKLVFIADMYICQNEFEKASSVIGKCNHEKAVAYKNYADGMVAFNKENYITAIGFFENAAKQELYDSSEKLIESNYLCATHYFEDKKYVSAKKYYNNAGDYKDAKQMCIACDLMLAEALLKNGQFNKGKEAYNKLPQDFTYNNISVANRVSVLNGLSSFAAVCGEWTATKNYIESRNVYKRTGSWESWYYDKARTDQTLEVNCYLNSDGTVNIIGNVSFYRFTNYSSLNKYCNATKKTMYFTIRNVKSIPYSYKIDSDTTLNYSGGVFSISYSVRDNYSTSFYNLYNSSVTYGNRTTIY